MLKALGRRALPDLLMALALLLLPLAHFAPVVLGSRTLLPADNLLVIEPWASAAHEFGVSQPVVPHNALLSDLVLQNYPWKTFILQSLQAGELPLWNPYQFAGLPFLAAGQHSALYPFSLIYYLVPLANAYGLFILSQFWLAGLFTYFFLRVLRVRRLSALFGAIAYQLSLFMVVSVVFPMIVAAAVWLPLILAAIELVVIQAPALGGRPATVPWLALGAGALGMQILAGHVEITYYTLLIAGAYSGWRLLFEFFRLRRMGAGPVAMRRLPARAAALLLLAALGVALGAIQLLPLYELVTLNFRSGSATFDQIMGWAYPWRHVVHLFAPNFYGNPSHHAYLDMFTGQWTPVTVNALGNPITSIEWGMKNFVEGGAYLGLLPPLLILVVALRGVFRDRTQPANPHHLFFLLLAGLSLAFAFPTRLYAIIYWLPGIDQLHSPFRWVWPLSLSAAVLSAFAMDHLASQAAPAARRWPALIRAWCLGAQPSVVTVVGGAAVWAGALGLAVLIVARLGYDALGVDRLMGFLLYDLARANEAFADGRMFFSYEARWLGTACLLLIGAGLVLRLSRSSLTWRGRPVWGIAALGLLALDLLMAGWGFNPAADARILAYTPPSVEFLRQDTSPWRYTTFDTTECDAARQLPCKPFNANAGWYFNLQDVRGYDSIFTRQYADYMGLIQDQYELDFNRIAPLNQLQALESPLLDLLNVKYIITQQALNLPKLRLVYDGEVRIYENLTVMPRAYTQPQTATITTHDFGQAVQTYDPRQYVIVAPGDASDAPGAPAEPQPAWPGPAEVLDYAPSEVWLTTSVSVPSWLVLADSYFPGWVAYLRPAGAGDDAEQPLIIRRVNGNFRGVELPAGEWTVRFKYSPDPVKIGGILSFIAGISLLFALLVYAWRYFYRESAVNSTARRVAKNSLAPMALNLTNRFIDLMFAAFMLRVLGPADAGKYYFAIVIFGWFEIFTNYGLNTLLTRDVSRDRGNANRYLVNTTILRLLLGFAAVPALAGLLALRQVLPSFEMPFGLGAFHPDRQTTDTLLAIGLLVIGQAPATVATGLSALFYAFEKAEYPAAVATISTIAKVSLGTVALVLGFGFVGLAGVSVIVNLITLAILGLLAWRMFGVPGRRLELDSGLQRHALRESFPLMINNLLATLFFKVDVTMLEPIRGAREVGWYSTAYKFIDAYNVIPSLFTFALFPVMARQAREDRPALQRTYALAVKLLTAVALPLAALTAAAAPIMVGLLGGAEYLPFGAVALAILVWSIPFGWVNSVTNYLLISLDQQRSLTRAFGLALVFNVVINLALLPRYGYAAAAATTIASELFLGLCFYWILRRSLGPVPWVKLLWKLWLAGTLMAGILFGLWGWQPLAALAASLLVYALVVGGLRAFSSAELSVLSGILPTRLQRKPRVPPGQE